MDIADWLRSLGLAQYEQRFRDNAIDLEILPELTETHLERFEVLLGHRKRIFVRSPTCPPRPSAAAPSLPPDRPRGREKWGSRPSGGS